MLDVGERERTRKRKGPEGKCLLSSLGPVVGVAIVTTRFSVSLACCKYRNLCVLSVITSCVCSSPTFSISDYSKRDYVFIFDAIKRITIKTGCSRFESVLLFTITIYYLLFPGWGQAVA
jgi:hypothetical protein